MAYKADPGGNFDSDTHRRVCGHLPLPSDDPTSVEALVDRMKPDEMYEVLQDLEADGHATQLKDGWKMTKSGLELLTGPVASEVEA